MNNNKTEIKGNGINLGFFDVLCLIFIVLKLTHVINWSWWIVFLPMIIQIIIMIIVIIVLFILDKKNIIKL